MATTTKEQGTGKHPHKSAKEPFPHNEAASTKGKGESQSSSSKRSSSSSKGGEQRQSASSSGKDESDGDLKSREYTGPDGQVHHHTRAYAESHKK